MEQEKLQKTLEALAKSGITVNGDLVLEKKVEYEVSNVEDGGIGIQINNGKESSSTLSDNNDTDSGKRHKNRVATKEMMSRAAKITLGGGYWKAQRSWSVIYEVYGIWGYQGRVTDFLEEVPKWPDGVDKIMACNRDAVEKLRNKYNFTKNIDEWRGNGVPEPYCILGEQLNAELEKLLMESEIAQ